MYSSNQAGTQCNDQCATMRLTATVPFQVFLGPHNNNTNPGMHPPGGN